jgi:exoribonuclease R
MLQAGVGLLRTLPPPDDRVVRTVRRTARALGVDWPDGAGYAEVVRALDSADPDQAALLALAARGLRGAGYLALDGSAGGAGPAGAARVGARPVEVDGAPDTEGQRDAAGGDPGVIARRAADAAGAGRGGGGSSADEGGAAGGALRHAAVADDDAVRHAAVAAPYAHVTAPLRRLCDRAAIEVLLAVYAGEAPSGDVVAQLPELPKAMAQATGREGGAARAAVDLVEALVLRPRIGEVVQATVVSADDDRSTVVVGSHAVQASIEGAPLPLGETVAVRVADVDVPARTVRLVPA